MIEWDTFKEQLRANPAQSLKSVLLLAGFLLLVWILVVMQADPITKNRVQVKPSGRLSNLNISSLNAKDSLAASADLNERPATLETPPKGESFSLLPAVFIFFAIVGGAWLWLRNKKKKQKTEINGKIYTTVATQQLPGGQQLLAAKLNEEYWIMAVGGHRGINLLHRYSEEEWRGVDQEPVENNWKNTLLKTLNTTEPKKN